jgi:hypothetical protein
MANESVCSTAVIVLTKRYKITGHIDLMPGSRLTDYISAIKSFFAVTDAVVEDIHTGKVIFRGEFMDVNRKNVEIILPLDAICDE